MAGSTKGAHPEIAVLHAYLAGEVDPAQRAVIKEHLDGCARCKKDVEQIASVRGLFGAMKPPQPDDLTWQRVGQSVLSELEAEARRSLPGQSSSARVWVPAALAAVAAAALLVWFAPRPGPGSAPSPPAPASDRAEASASRIVAGDAPLQIGHPSGATVDVAPHTVVTLTSPPSADLGLELDKGTVGVTALARVSDDPRILLTTPGFRGVARSRDFSVSFWASESWVTVREGEVAIDASSDRPSMTVRAGERRRVNGSQPPAPPRTAEPPPPAPAAPPAERKVEPKRVEPPKTTTAVAVGPPAPEPALPAEPAPPPAPEASSAEGETSVEVVAPSDDPVAQKWAEASEAFYKRQDTAAAIAAATWVAQHGGHRQEVALAHALLCQAYVAAGQPAAAVDSCQRQILLEPNEENVRELHYKIGTILMSQLHDCPSAIPHFTKAFVFGRGTPLDDEAHLMRARCALEIGDVDRAELDLTILERRAKDLARPAEFVELKRKLAVIKSGRESRAPE